MRCFLASDKTCELWHPDSALIVKWPQLPPKARVMHCPHLHRMSGLTPRSHVLQGCQSHLRMESTLLGVLGLNDSCPRKEELCNGAASSMLPGRGILGEIQVLPSHPLTLLLWRHISLHSWFGISSPATQQICSCSAKEAFTTSCVTVVDVGKVMMSRVVAAATPTSGCVCVLSKNVALECGVTAEALRQGGQNTGISSMLKQKK